MSRALDPRQCLGYVLRAILLPGAALGVPAARDAAARSSQEQPGAAGSWQELPGAARSSQEQPGAARSSRRCQEPAGGTQEQKPSIWLYGAARWSRVLALGLLSFYGLTPERGRGVASRERCWQSVELNLSLSRCFAWRSTERLGRARPCLMSIVSDKLSSLGPRVQGFVPKV